jgi:hypothetical protein
MQTIRRFLIFFAVQFLLLSFALPSWASEDPLRLAFINASQKGGGDAHETLLEFLDASDDIKVKDSDKIWDAAEEEGVSRKDFRNSKRRDSSAREFRRVMKSLNIEAIMILDVFSKGKKLQLVVIGPSGKTIADVRENIKRGKVSKAESKTILKEAFAELVPQVRDFRDAGGWDAVDDEPRKEDPVEEPDEEDPDEEDPDEEDPDSSTSLKDSAVASNNGDFGLEPGFTFRFGALVGSRSFTTVRRPSAHRCLEATRLSPHSLMAQKNSQAIMAVLVPNSCSRKPFPTKCCSIFLVVPKSGVSQSTRTHSTPAIGTFRHDLVVF